MQRNKPFINIVAFLLLTSIFAAIPTFSAQPPVATRTYYIGAIGQARNVDSKSALTQIDLDVTRTIIPIIKYDDVYVWKKQMRIGYVNFSYASSNPAKQLFMIHVRRTDSVPGLVAAVLALKRTNESWSPAESVAYPNSTYVLLGPAPDPGVAVYLIHYEDGSVSTLPATKTGVIWRMGAQVDVISSDAQDTNLTNNYQADGTTVAYSATTGDINGDGIVDILDAIILAGVYGKQQGQAGYNADANLNTTPDPVSGKQIIDILDAITLANNFGKHNQP